MNLLRAISEEIEKLNEIQEAKDKHLKHIKTWILDLKNQGKEDEVIINMIDIANIDLTLNSELCNLVDEIYEQSAQGD